MVADECAQEQACELVAERLVETDDPCRPDLMDAVQPGALLKDERECAICLRGGGFHIPAYRRSAPDRRSLPGVSTVQRSPGSPVLGAGSASGAGGAVPPSRM